MGIHVCYLLDYVHVIHIHYTVDFMHFLNYFDHVSISLLFNIYILIYKDF